jgi:hypothetical protein
MRWVDTTDHQHILAELVIELALIVVRQDSTGYTTEQSGDLRKQPEDITSVNNANHQFTLVPEQSQPDFLV